MITYSRHALGWIFFLLLPLDCTTLVSGYPSYFFCFSVELLNSKVYSIHHVCCNFQNLPMVLEMYFRAVLLLLYFVINASS
jgi:hypothetical protein